jgi:Herpesviridae UL52/UL70 DNA primase
VHDTPREGPEPSKRPLLQGMTCHLKAPNPQTSTVAGPGSHWCGNVGRAHASNNVHYVAHLRGGRFAQKCHDPECSGYRSPWAQLPPALCLPLLENLNPAAAGLPNLTARSDD